MKRVHATQSILIAAALALASAGTVSRAITLDEYLDVVRSNHPFFAKEEMQKEIDEKRSQRFLGAEDWLVESTPLFTHSEPVQSSPFEPKRVDHLRLDASVGRAFWGTGSRLSVFWQTQVTDQDLPGFEVSPGVEVPIGPSTWWSNALGARWSLPLLRNRGGALDRLEYDLSRYDVDIGNARSLENREQFLLEAALTFVEWALADEQRRIAEERLELATDELDRTRQKRRENLVDEADVLRAEDAVHVARNARALLDSRWQSLQAELATLAQMDEPPRRPEYDLYDRPVNGDEDELVRRVTERSRVLNAIDTQFEQLTRLESASSEAARPELALTLAGLLMGGDNDFDGSLDITNPEVSVGLEFRYPLGNRTAIADLEETRLRLRQLELARDDVEVSLESNARAIVVQLRELGDVLSGNVQRIETARRKTIEEQRIYERGRGDLTFVIQSRDNESIAKLSYAENAALHHELVLRYLALADELLPLPDAE